MNEKELEVQEFNKLVNQLTTMRWQFEVVRCDMLDEDHILVKNIPALKQHLGKDIRLLIAPIENTEFVIFEFDVNGVIEAREELENWI